MSKYVERSRQLRAAEPEWVEPSDVEQSGWREATTQYVASLLAYIDDLEHELRFYRSSAEKVEALVEAVGLILAHDCDEVIHPACWRAVEMAYAALEEGR